MYQPEFKIGLFAIGLDAYWEQFEGLREKLEGYLQIVADHLSRMHPGIINAGLVDTIDKAFEAGKKFRTEDVDVIFLYVSTYAVSATVLPVVQRSKVPVIILNLAPEAAIDYAAFNALADRTAMTGKWLSYCSPCPVPEIANVFKRTGIKFHQVTGLLQDDEECWNEVREWVDAAKVAHTMFHNRVGCMGHYYPGMLDIYTDVTLQLKYFGGHFEMIEVDELSALRNEVSEDCIQERMGDFRNEFEIAAECPLEELHKAAKTSVALDKMVAKYKLGSLAYYYRGWGKSDNAETISSIILGTSLLTANHIAVAGEYELKNVQAMKIMDSFGAGGSFTEFYAMDYKDDVIIMGHDGPGHIGIAVGKTKVRSLPVFHGKLGSGLSVEMTVRHGNITCLSVLENGNGQLSLLVAEGQSVPGAILLIGNTNSRYKFPVSARQFVNDWNSHGPAHHCAVGVGHIGSRIKKLGALLQMDVIQVC